MSRQGRAARLMGVQDKVKPVKEYKVALFRSPESIRGWLAYSMNSLHRYTSSKPDKIVTVQAKDISQAKNRAITMINANEAPDSA